MDNREEALKAFGGACEDVDPVNAARNRLIRARREFELAGEAFDAAEGQPRAPISRERCTHERYTYELRIEKIAQSGRHCASIVVLCAFCAAPWRMHGEVTTIGRNNEAQMLIEPPKVEERTR